MAKVYHSNCNIKFLCIYHVIWCPKYRRGVLKDGVDIRLKAILQEVAMEKRVKIMAIEIMADHVHLVLDVDPQFGIHRVIKAMKGRSSRLLRQEFPALKRRLPTLWTNSYFVATVGGAPLDVLKQYVEDQKTV